MTQAGSPDGSDRRRDRVWTIPNVISFLRLAVLLPIVVWLLLSDRMWWALIALVALSASDWIDGYLARRLGQVSLLGTRLDPVADRVAIVVVGLALAIAGIVPWWVVIVIASVDLVLLLLAATWFRGSPDLPVSRIGKWRTAALLAALPLLIVAEATGVAWLHVVGLVLISVGAAGHVVAGIGYAVGMARARTRSGRPDPASAPSA